MKEKTLQQRKMTCLLTSSEELDDSDMQIIFQFNQMRALSDLFLA